MSLKQCEIKDRDFSGREDKSEDEYRPDNKGTPEKDNPKNANRPGYEKTSVLKDPVPRRYFPTTNPPPKRGLTPADGKAEPGMIPGDYNTARIKTAAGKPVVLVANMFQYLLKTIPVRKQN